MIVPLSERSPGRHHQVNKSANPSGFIRRTSREHDTLRIDALTRSRMDGNDHGQSVFGSQAVQHCHQVPELPGSRCFPRGVR